MCSRRSRRRELRLLGSATVRLRSLQSLPSGFSVVQRNQSSTMVLPHLNLLAMGLGTVVAGPRVAFAAVRTCLVRKMLQ